MKSISQAELPDRVVKWIIDSAAPHSTVESVRQLHGGASSVVHSVSLSVKGEAKEFVVRQFDNADWLHAEPDLALHEAESLRLADAINVQTPQIIAYDQFGSECGIPAVIMTKLEGNVTLKPRNAARWINGLAEALVSIHELEAANFPWTYFTYNDFDSLEAPQWSSFPELWNRAINIVKESRSIGKECFIHRDYHPTNVLWKKNKVSGVVDWVNACRGPAGIDVGHCRLNLAQLFDVQTADAFLASYKNQAGHKFSYDPYWDLTSLMDMISVTPSVYPGWKAFGVNDLTEKIIIERLDSYIISLLKRD